MAKMSIAVLQSFTTRLTFSGFTRDPLVQPSAEELFEKITMSQAYQVRVQCSICHRYARLLNIVEYAIGYFEDSLVDDILIRSVGR